MSFLGIEAGKVIFGEHSEANLPIIGSWVMGMGIMSYRMANEGKPDNGQKLLLNLAGVAIPCLLTIRW